jgi:uncharacterized protein YqeY
MLRKELADALKTAMKARQERAVSTVRLILAALKDRDIAARGQGHGDGISDDDIRDLLQTMIRQRRETIPVYRKAGRLDLAHQEEEEIAVIERFLPKALDEAEVEAAIAQAVATVGATSIKDMGKVMAALRQAYAGRIDFARAGERVKALLARPA